MTETLTRTCDPATSTTKALLGWGVVAGPAYVAVSLAQALSHDGFDLSRHSWSLLAAGPYGWIQSANLILTGLLTAAFALGLHRAVGGAAPRLLGGYGLGLVASGLFEADPAGGYPVGAPEAVGWHGTLHVASGGVGFLCLVAACLLLGRRFAAAGRAGWALSARVVGIGFLAAFAGITTGSTAAVPPFVAAVVLACGWLAALAVDTYRRV